MIKGFDPLIIIVFGGLGSMTGTIVASVGFALIIEGLRVISARRALRTGALSSTRSCCCW